MEDNKLQPNSIPEIPTQKVVETLATDMAGVLGDESGGVVKKIIAEEEARDAEKNKISPESNENRIYIGLGLIFITISLVTFGYLFFKTKGRTVDVATPVDPMVFIDKITFIDATDLTKDDVVSAMIKEMLAPEINNGAIEGVYLKKNNMLLGLRAFLKLMDSSITLPANNFIDDNFLLGFLNNEGRGPFVLLKVSSIPDVFNTFRTWENKMYPEVGNLLGMTERLEPASAVAEKFVDGFIENKNARFLYKNDGSIALVYALADEHHIVIANTTEAVREIIFRLAGNKIAQ
jgi:hypothetical protein